MTSPTDEFGSIKDYDVYRNINLKNVGDVVKNAKGKFHGYFFYNNATTVRWLKIYDKATAAGVGDTPKLTFGLPPYSSDNVEIGGGIRFTNGISVRVSTLVADNDNTAPADNDVVLNLYYR